MRTSLLVPLLFHKQIGAGSFPALAHYWDQQFAAQCFQDSARTIASVLADPVGSWTDRIGNAHLAQTTDANRLINRLTDGVEFADSTDFLTATITTLPATGFTLYTKIFPDTFAPAAGVFIDWGNMTISIVQTSGRVTFSLSGVGVIGTSAVGNPLIISTMNTVGIRYNPTDGAWRIAVNAGTPDTGTQIRAVSGTSLHIGSENGASFPFDGKMKSLAIHTTLHTNAEMDAAMAYFRSIS